MNITACRLVSCFKKLSHPRTGTKDGIMKITNRAFVCLNNDCPNRFVVISRGKLSALVIGLIGASQFIFGVIFLCFDPHSTKEKQAKFKKSVFAFQTEIACRLALGEGITLEVSISSRNIHNSISSPIYSSILQN